jgi:hypothetical protein
MEDNAKLIEKLLERVVEYGKTSSELLKLKALDKLSAAFSSLALHSVAFVLFASFMLFLNLGLAFWLGDITGKSYYGFFLVGGFYILSAVVISLFMRKWLVKITRDYIIKHLLK